MGRGGSIDEVRVPTIEVDSNLIEVGEVRGGGLRLMGMDDLIAFKAVEVIF